MSSRRLAIAEDSCADEMAKIVNELIADAAEAEKENERLLSNLRASLEATFDHKRELDLAIIERDRYRLQRDFLLTLLPPEVDPFQIHAFMIYLAQTLNRIEQEEESDSDNDSDSDSD
jgi:hypothetical protein